MKAVILNGVGDVSQLELQDVNRPACSDDQILIHIKAFSINPIEVKTRKGNVFSEFLLNDKPSILGWDAAGIVEEVGKNVTSYKKGDAVYGVLGFPKFGKTYAEYSCTTPEMVQPIPGNLNFAEAAAGAIVGLTAYQALAHHADLKPGKKILIHAASGGVGHLAVQLAKHFGAEVWATASAKKQDFLKQLGADHCIDYKTQNFEEIAQDMDVVFDMIGGEYIDRSLSALKPGGCIISIPSVNNGDVVEKAEAKGRKGVRFIMTTNPEDLQAITSLYKQGAMKPFVSKTYPLTEIKAAHQELENGHVTGKIALTTS